MRRAARKRSPTGWRSAPLRSQPSAPSASCLPTSTTVLSKFGSRRRGPASRKAGARLRNAMPPFYRSAGAVITPGPASERPAADLSSERLLEVGPQVLGILQTDGEPDQALGDAHLPLGLRRHHPVGHRPGVLDEGVAGAQADRRGGQADAGKEGEGRVEAAAQIEGEQRARSLHLPPQ